MPEDDYTLAKAPRTDCNGLDASSDVLEHLASLARYWDGLATPLVFNSLYDWLVRIVLECRCYMLVFCRKW